MRGANPFQSWICDRRGATAVEFSLVLPIFIGLVVAMIYTGQLALSLSSMNYAVQEGARCAAVQTAVCPDTAATLAFTKAHYQGVVDPAPIFSYSTSSCGHAVTGTQTIAVLGMPQVLSVPISATACFP